MAVYQYNASDEQGAEVTGQVTADNTDAARRTLAARGLEVHELHEVAADSPGAQPRLSVTQAEELTDHLAHLGAGQLPLGDGLRAAAAESGNGRVAEALREIAARVDRGESLDAVVTDSPSLFPRHIGGLVTAASRTGKLGVALAELLEHQRAARELRQNALQCFAYPAFVAGLALLVIWFALFIVADRFLEMFEELALQLPMSTQLLVWWREIGWWILGLALLASFATAVVTRLLLGRASWQRLVAGVPIIGPLSYWSGLAEWCSLLTVLIKNRIALPDALRLSSEGVRNAYIGRLSADLAARTAGGGSLAEALAGSGVPVSLAPLVRWGEKVGLLHEAFATAQELFERRVRIRAVLLQSVLPPILFVVIACLVMLVVGALFAPMLSMIHSLN